MSNIDKEFLDKRYIELFYIIRTRAELNISDMIFAEEGRCAASIWTEVGETVEALEIDNIARDSRIRRRG